MIKWVLGLLVSIFVCATSLSHFFSIQHFHFSAYDLGLHLNGIWKIAFSEDQFNYLRGTNYLGDHLWLIAYPISWLIKVFPSFFTFFFLQALLLGLSALVVYFIARRETKDELFSGVLGIAWLIHPALWNMNMEGFYPELTATFFLLLAIFFFLRRRTLWLFVFLSLACLGKEDIALTAIAFCVAIAWRTRNPRYLLGAGFYLGWFLVSLYVILPHFNSVGFFRFSEGYWFAEFKNRWSDFSFYGEVFWNKTVLIYVIGLLGPLLLLPIRGFWILVPALPSFTINLLSNTDYLRSVDRHYNNQILPFLFVAAILGYQKIRSQKMTKIVTAGLVASSLGFFVWMAKVPLAAIYFNVRTLVMAPQSGDQIFFEEIKAEFLRSPKTTISAFHTLTPNLAFRDRVYHWPNPFKTKFFGLSEGEGASQPHYLPEFVLLVKDPESVSAIQGYPYEVVRDSGHFILYRRLF